MPSTTNIQIRMMITGLVGAALLCFQACREPGRPSDVPMDADALRNVVLIVSDDHGKTAGCYGNPVVQTPNIDRLASEGTLFTHAFATTASCTASRSVILSGLQNHRTGLYGHMHYPSHFRAYEGLRSLPVVLAESGYRTASAGKYHVAPERVFAFDQYISIDDLGEGTDYREASSGRNTVMMAEACRAFIEARSEKPFFLYYCTSDPHRSGRGNPNRFGNRDEGYEGVEAVQYSPEEVVVPYFLPDTRACREELAEYYQSISRLDQGVGRIMQILRESGQYDNTLMIYMSDHGMAFPGAKTTTYEPGLNAPLIVRSPDVQSRGVVCDAMVSWVDIMPTILDYAGIEPPTPYRLLDGEGGERAIVRQLHGRSFLPVLETAHPEGYDTIFASHTFHEIQMYYPMRVIRDRKYKLIWNIAWQLPYPFASDLWAAQTWQTQFEKGMKASYGTRTVGEYIQRPEFELYDMEHDVQERHNLAEEPSHAGVLANYKQKLRTFQDRTGDRWLLKWMYD